MRIGIVSPMVLGYGMTPETYSSQQLSLASRWAEADQHVDLYTLPGQGLESYPLHMRINVHLCRGGIVGATGLPIMFGFQRALRGEKHDFIFSSEHYQITTAMACAASRRVLIYQGQNIQGASFKSKTLLTAMESTFGRFSQFRCMGVVAKTNQAAEFLRMRLFPNIRTILCGYDESRFRLPSATERSQSREKYGMGEGILTLVYAGNLIARRDLQTALDAVSKLKKNGHNVQFLIAGQGPEQDILESYARALGINDITQFLGLCTWEQLRQIYWAGDLFVFPSHHEIFGLVVLEAMACGLTVFSTSVGASKDVIESGVNGFLFPFQDDSAIVHSVESLIADPSRRHKIQATSISRLQRYSWEAIAQDIILYAEQLIERIENPNIQYTGKFVNR